MRKKHGHGANYVSRQAGIIHLLPLIIIGVLVLGVIFYFNPTSSPDGQDSETPLITQPSPSPDPSAAEAGAMMEDEKMEGWKTYSSSEFNFVVDIPDDFEEGLVLNNEYNRVVSFVKDGTAQFEVRLSPNNSNFKLEEYFYLDFPISSTTKVAGKSANIYIAKNGYCDGLGCSEPFVVYVVLNENDFYEIIFLGKDKISETESQILSTFEFTK